ncbi:hypothetical protein BC938DRAFT_474814 [Jimgerdemannia flammicorona]|uniref:Uncharacterized protein n=1 Tax=Jimgerdemannia flammicorona TaxID=994334 RepID=A0A433QZF1_9FUNG|nr:hypothetical protein BC938DRAFT_474814 [Jimgerdemannia flammicorona]
MAFAIAVDHTRTHLIGAGAEGGWYRPDNFPEGLAAGAVSGARGGQIRRIGDGEINFVWLVRRLDEEDGEIGH